MNAAYLVGVGLGLAVAAQPGPISMLLVRSVLRGTITVGLAMGAAVAMIDMLYAGLGVAGIAPILTVGWLGVLLGLLGAGVLVYIGVRTLWTAWRVRMGSETAAEVASPKRAFWTVLGATASNPLTIISWAAIFAAASSAGSARGAGATLLMLAGVGSGSLAWMVALSCAIAAGRKYAGPRAISIVDMVAGVGIAVFGVALAVRTVDQQID